MFTNNIEKLIKYLKVKSDSGDRILLITTSNRWIGSGEIAKSTKLARLLGDRVPNSEVIDISKLKIYPCEGNVSREGGNRCGLKESLIKDSKKNPHKFIRCWASLNNPDDEMYIVANKIWESDIIIFFGSVRWGKMNTLYSNLLERLTWMEARHSSLGESNILKDKEAGIVVLGHNFNVGEVVKLEKKNLEFFGFKTPKEISFGRQWTGDSGDESLTGYKRDYKDFLGELGIFDKIDSTIKKFIEWVKK
jgi:multimeric flavodoxin WrbA